MQQAAPPQLYLPPKQETALPLLAGIFNIIAAVGWFIAAGLGLLAFIGFICIIPGVFALIAGVLCFQRTNWTLALVFSILSANILSLIFVAVSKEEFDWPQNVQPQYVQPQYVPPAYVAPSAAPTAPQAPAAPAPGTVPSQPSGPAPEPTPEQPAAGVPPPVCSNCGAPLSTDAKFCAACGAAV